VKPETSIVAELTWPQVHAFRMARHHLLMRAPKRDLAKVVGDIAGAQAQVMSAAELQVCVRVSSSTDDVRRALWKERTLVKTWLMRGTLHLVPAMDLPIYTAAMRTRWIKTRNAWLKFMGMTELELMRFIETIGVVLDGDPRTREEILELAAKGRPERVRAALRSGWGGLLKPVARQGLLCFGPNRGQNVTFVRPEQWLGRWRDVDPDAALVEVARRYLRAYGPATKSDFARWWGSWTGVANAAWSGLSGELAAVSVEGRHADALAADLSQLAEAQVSDAVQLLPSFDPYLMGHSGRSHLFDAVHSPKVSRTAGWISAVVLVDGRVMGTWTHSASGGRLRVAVAPFARLPARVVARLREKASCLAEALGMGKSEVEIAA
jgi:hypothetical protein